MSCRFVVDSETLESCYLLKYAFSLASEAIDEQVHFARSRGFWPIRNDRANKVLSGGADANVAKINKHGLPSNTKQWRCELAQSSRVSLVMQDFIVTGNFCNVLLSFILEAGPQS